MVSKQTQPQDALCGAAAEPVQIHCDEIGIHDRRTAHVSKWHPDDVSRNLRTTRRANLRLANDFKTQGFCDCSVDYVHRSTGIDNKYVLFAIAQVHAHFGVPALLHHGQRQAATGEFQLAGFSLWFPGQADRT